MDNENFLKFFTSENYRRLLLNYKYKLIKNVVYDTYLYEIFYNINILIISNPLETKQVHLRLDIKDVIVQMDSAWKKLFHLKNLTPISTGGTEVLTGILHEGYNAAIYNEVGEVKLFSEITFLNKSKETIIVECLKILLSKYFDSVKINVLPTGLTVHFERKEINNDNRIK